MIMLAEGACSIAIVIGAIVLGAMLAFWILKKIVKLVLSLVIVALIAAVAVFYCVKVGYISQEDAEKLNPISNEQIRQTTRDAGEWAGAKARDAARKAVDAAVRVAVDRAVQTDAAQRVVTGGERMPNGLHHAPSNRRTEQ